MKPEAGPEAAPEAGLVTAALNGQPGNGASSQRYRIGILGAGFGGLGIAIKLREAGIDDFVIWERDADVGGTWWANTYPGCQCDIPSHLYSFSFAPNPEWTRTYPLQPEIKRYLGECTERYGLREHIRAGCEVTGAAWDEDEGVWRIETVQGPFTVDLFMAAPGFLSEPSTPALPGLETFEGEAFHTARWNHDHDLTGRRVAVIGTGASAIQTVPRIQPIAEHVDVFQRTPPWVVPHRDRPITDIERRVYRRFPALQRVVRSAVYWSREMLVPGFVRNPRLMKLPQSVARRHLERNVSDPALRARLMPDYSFGCKRVLPSNEWYPAITQPNVDVVTERIDRVVANGIVTADGVLHEVDTIVFATGFHVTDAPFAKIVRGRDGVLMSDLWNGSPQAYRGTAVAGFPNLFVVTGPNTGLGHNSLVYMIEAQLDYLMDALRVMRERGATRIEVRRAAQDAYNADLQSRMGRTVWNSGGCSSWYIDAQGKNTTIWPDYTWRFRRQTRTFDSVAYELSAPATATAPEPAPATA
jgi:cation diffusion facilitator CzcD-associated flavoprotein CzcO